MAKLLKNIAMLAQEIQSFFATSDQWVRPLRRKFGIDRMVFCEQCQRFMTPFGDRPCVRAKNETPILTGGVG